MLTVARLTHRSQSTLRSDPATTVSVTAPYLRSASNLARNYRRLVLTTVPCAILGVWQNGVSHVAAGDAVAQRVRNIALANDTLGQLAGLASNIVEPILVGIVVCLPVICVVLATGWLTDAAISRLRRREPECGLMPALWLYALMLPTSTGLWVAAYGAAVAMLSARALFGGVGQYVIHPALVGLVVVAASYPPAFVPAAGASVSALFEPAHPGLDGLRVALWGTPGMTGIGSSLLVAIGGAYLLATRTVDWRLPVAAVAGLIATVLMLDLFSVRATGSWVDHAITGSFLFCVMFVATDATTAGHMRSTRWITGALIGLATALIRIADTSHPEGVFHAAMLAALFAPITDRLFVALNAARRKREQQELDKYWHAERAD